MALRAVSLDFLGTLARFRTGREPDRVWAGVLGRRRRDGGLAERDPAAAAPGAAEEHRVGELMRAAIREQSRASPCFGNGRDTPREARMPVDEWWLAVAQRMFAQQSAEGEAEAVFAEPPTMEHIHALLKVYNGAQVRLCIVSPELFLLCHTRWS
jgi:hypothetical protein